ncbi:MAG TPA: DHH family phosphoesterase [Candidatus Moranbacteria bacterium]|nr:DHH family phosphoesterase [Candidatus Moranbacteria bacterium]
MALEPQEQFKKFLDNSKEILVLIPENPSSDAVGSAWALYFFLEKRGHFPTIAFSNNLSPRFGFLTKPDRMIAEISGARDFVLSFDIARNKIKEIRHEEKDGRFNIYLTPEKGSIDPRDFSFILAKFKYDLIIVLDSPDLESLGKLYNSNTDLFFEVPVINIDHRSNNDNFGQINLVDVTASSCSEIVERNLKNIDENLIDKNIATCLLAGIIGATESFQKKNTTPRALSISAALMDKGADQQEIVRWLYKTHSLSLLKLWGRSMAKLNWNTDLKLAWTKLTVEDFVQSRAKITDIGLILEKLQENYSEGKIFMTTYNDTPMSSMVVIRAVDREILNNIYINFGGEIKKDVLEIKTEEKDLEKVGKSMEEKLKSVLAV